MNPIVSDPISRFTRRLRARTESSSGAAQSAPARKRLSPAPVISRASGRRWRRARSRSSSKRPRTTVSTDGAPAGSARKVKAAACAWTAGKGWRRRAARRTRSPSLRSPAATPTTRAVARSWTRSAVNDSDSRTAREREEVAGADGRAPQGGPHKARRLGHDDEGGGSRRRPARGPPPRASRAVPARWTRPPRSGRAGRSGPSTRPRIGPVPSGRGHPARPRRRAPCAIRREARGRSGDGQELPEAAAAVFEALAERPEPEAERPRGKGERRRRGGVERARRQRDLDLPRDGRSFRRRRREWTCPGTPATTVGSRRFRGRELLTAFAEELVQSAPRREDISRRRSTPPGLCSSPPSLATACCPLRRTRIPAELRNGDVRQDGAAAGGRRRGSPLSARPRGPRSPRRRGARSSGSGQRLPERTLSIVVTGPPPDRRERGATAAPSARATRPPRH